MIDAKNRSIHKWNRLPAFYAHFDRLEAISYPTSRFKMERIRIFLRPNGPSVYLAQANGLGTEFNTDTIGPTPRLLFVLVGPTNGRAFGPNRLFGRGFLGRWPRLGKQMALWAETILREKLPGRSTAQLAIVCSEKTRIGSVDAFLVDLAPF